MGACIWIYIKFYEERVDESFLIADKIMRTRAEFDYPSLTEDLYKKMSDAYINAIYFTTTTMTTIGYGDTNGDTEIEMVYLMILFFTGIAIFTLI